MSDFPNKYLHLLYFFQASNSYFGLLSLVLNVFEGGVTIFVKINLLVGGLTHFVIEVCGNFFRQGVTLFIMSG